METISQSLHNINQSYRELLKLSSQSFRALKTKNLNDEKNIQNEMNKKFKYIIEENKKIKKGLREKGGRNFTRISDLLPHLKDNEREYMLKLIDEMISLEKKLHDQLELNTEMAKSMRDIEQMKLNVAVEVSKRDRIDKTGAVLFEEEY